MKHAVVSLSLGMALLLGCQQQQAPPAEPITVEPATQAEIDQPPPAPATGAAGLPRPYYGVRTIEENILRSDVIVRATLVSRDTIVEQDTMHRKWFTSINFSFRVTEYLKGSGPAQIVASVRDRYWFDTRSLAEAASQSVLALHYTRWDDREAIVFLESTGAAGRFELDTWLRIDGFDDGYSLASIWSRLWLPAAGPPTADAGGRSANQQADPLFLLDVPSTTTDSGGNSGGGIGRSVSSNSAPTTALTISLSSLKQLVTTLEAEANAGGTDAYYACVEFAYTRERQLEYPGVASLRLFEKEIPSGQPAGTVLYEYGRFALAPDNYGEVSFAGPDASIAAYEAVDFSTSTAYGTPVADVPSRFGPLVWHTGRVVAARPLPGGRVYRFYRNHKAASQLICNKFSPLEFNRHLHVVTVTAPAGTLHEALFDPVAIGGAVGADGVHGVLKPAAFTVGGAGATITGVEWESGTVTMTLSPASLAGHAIDFIALDGSVSLTLSFDDATQSGGTLTWSVASQPWNDGDLLMLRIRSTGAIITPPTASPTPMLEPTRPITVKLTPRAEGSATYTNIAIAWDDPQACDGNYFVALNTSTGHPAPFMDFHPVPATTSLSEESYVRWDLAFTEWAARPSDFEYLPRVLMHEFGSHPLGLGTTWGPTQWAPQR